MKNLQIKNELVELPKDYVDIGSITFKIASTGQTVEVVEVAGIKNSHSITLTVRPEKQTITEDADFEIVKPKQISNEKTT